MARKGTAKEVFIDRVLTIYMKEGLHTTMDEISKRLKISKRTIYEQFEDKTDLIRSCVQHLQEQIPPYVRVETDEDVVSYLYDLLHNHVRVLFGERARFILNLQENYPELYEELFAPLLEKTKGELISALQEGMVSGYVRSGFDTELLFSYMMKHVYLVASDHDDMAKDHTLDELFNHSLLLPLRGLLTDKGVKALDAMMENK